MACQDVKVAESRRVISGPALQNHHPKKKQKTKHHYTSGRETKAQGIEKEKQRDKEH